MLGTFLQAKIRSTMDILVEEDRNTCTEYAIHLWDDFVQWKYGSQFWYSNEDHTRGGTHCIQGYVNEMDYDHEFLFDANIFMVMTDRRLGSWWYIEIFLKFFCLMSITEGTRKCNSDDEYFCSTLQVGPNLFCCC